jgi:hypothetical protein
VGRTAAGLAGAVAVVILLASCSAPVASGTGHPGAPATTGLVTGPDPCGVVAVPGVVVSGAPGPCRASAPVGVTVRVALDPGFDWDTPTSDSGAIRVADVVRPQAGGLEADLVTARAGQARVSATGTVICAPGQRCPRLARLWLLLVTATA